MPPRQLPRKLSQHNPPKAKILKKKIQNDIQYDNNLAIPFFSAMCIFSLLLPPIYTQGEEFKKYFELHIIDEDMRDLLERKRVINWCRTVKKLYSLKTTGDGNCLLHAVSLYMWGVHDSLLLLRRAVYAALVEDEESKKLQRRWRREKMKQFRNISDDIRLDTVEWEREWDNLVRNAEDKKQEATGENLPFECLEDLHVFVLANILRRPIIILSDEVLHTLYGSTLGPNTIGGIYLPLLCKPIQCSKNPIILGYDMNHFVPLVGMQGSTDQENVLAHAEKALPLVNSKLEPLTCHFLEEGEENRIYGILQEYLKLTEVNLTSRNSIQLVLAAKLEHKQLPDDLNLMNDFYKACRESFIKGERSKQYGAANINVYEPGDKYQPIKKIGFKATQKILNISGPLTLSEDPQDEEDPKDIQFNISLDPTPAMNPQVVWSTSCVKCDVRNGDPANQNLCGRCYQAIQTSQRSKSEPLTPTAPAPSEPVFERMYPECSVLTTQCAFEICTNQAAVSTHPYCHDHATEELRDPPSPSMLLEGQEPCHHAPSRLFSQASVTSFRCLFNGCGNYTSVDTQPYCYEHIGGGAPRVNGHGILPAPQEEHEENNCSSLRTAHVVGPARPRTGTGSVHASEAVAVPAPRTPPSSKRYQMPCKSPKCKCAGVPHYQGFCTMCFCSSSPDPEEELCREAGSVQPTQEDDTQVKEAELVDESRFTGNEGEEGGLLTNAMYHQIQSMEAKTRKPNHIREEGAYAANVPSDTSLEERRELESLEILARLFPAESKRGEFATSYHKCTKPGCERSAVKNEHELCPQCLVTAYKAGDLSPCNEKVLPMASKNEPPVHNLLRHRTNGVQQNQQRSAMRSARTASTPNPLQAASGLRPLQTKSCRDDMSIQMSVPPRSLTSIEKLETNAICLFEMCQNQGSVGFNGLCATCHKSLCEKVAKQPMPRETATKQINPMPGPSVVERERMKGMEPHPVVNHARIPENPNPVAKLCKNGRCDRYGDPGLDDFCFGCYRQLAHGNVGPDLASQPHQERGRDNYLLKTSEKHRYVAAASGVHDCRAPGCRNKGNSKCKGYCNSCHTNLSSYSPTYY